MSLAEYDVAVAAQDWRSSVTELVGQGWDYLEFLTGLDCPEDEAVEVVVGLRRIGDASPVRLLSTRLDRGGPVVDSLASILPAAAWHERETYEMFGVRFAGNDDMTALLLDHIGDWPLRRTTPLPARLTTRWPGLSDPADNPPVGQPGSDVGGSGAAGSGVGGSGVGGSGAAGSGVGGSGRTRSRRRTSAIPGNCQLWQP